MYSKPTLWPIYINQDAFPSLLPLFFPLSSQGQVKDGVLSDNVARPTKIKQNLNLQALHKLQHYITYITLHTLHCIHNISTILHTCTLQKEVMP